LVWTRDQMSDVVVFELAERGADAPLPANPTEVNSTKVNSAEPRPPEDGSPEDGSMEIEAWSATELDEDWRLPTLEPQAVSWLYGRATVEIASELALTDLMGSNV